MQCCQETRKLAYYIYITLISCEVLLEDKIKVAPLDNGEEHFVLQNNDCIEIDVILTFRFVLLAYVAYEIPPTVIFFNRS